MAMERIVQFECKVCGRKIDVTRSGDVYEEPVFCCGVETAELGTAAPAAARPAAKKAKKKAAKKARKKPAKKKAARKAGRKKAARRR